MIVHYNIFIHGIQNMAIKAGLVGLPNVWKSTLFNALTKSSIPMENYPFCTIDPNVAITEVPDERMLTLQKIYSSQKLIPTSLSFVDIAGLVAGAATGEGLGNQFLSHIREVDLILHVLRCFDDSSIIRTGKVDPINDFEVIVQELMLKDLESVDKRIPKVEKLMRGNINPQEKKQLTQELELLHTLKKELDNGTIDSVKKILSQFPIPTTELLSGKNFLIIANVSEDDLQNDMYTQNQYYQSLVKKFGQSVVIPVSARIEHELSLLEKNEQDEMMQELGITHKGLDQVIKTTFNYLNLITFFTCGPKEIHAWQIKKGTTAREAAGEIHSDLQRGFICCETLNYDALVQHGSPVAAKQAGKYRIEGSDYIVQDGDIINVRFNV